MGDGHLTGKGDYMFSFDLQDGFYALGIEPSDRDYFTVNIRGTLYRLGARVLPYVDDFLLFASSSDEPEALQLLQRVADLLDNLGLHRKPAKGLWEPELKSLAGRARYIYLAIPSARFYLREIHDVVGSTWGGRVHMTHQLPPTQFNGRPIHRGPAETAYVHCDSSGYGRDACAAPAAYAIGVVLKKIKHFGGWAELSSVVLDYINPTALPYAALWQLFGWLTPWGGPPAACCPPIWAT
eukprot:jgi/Tetstr1/423423/TSEL_014104.t1